MLWYSFEAPLPSTSPRRFYWVLTTYVLIQNWRKLYHSYHQILLLSNSPFYNWSFWGGGSGVVSSLCDLEAARCGAFFVFCLFVVLLGSCLTVWSSCWSWLSWLLFDLWLVYCMSWFALPLGVIGRTITARYRLIKNAIWDCSNLACLLQFLYVCFVSDCLCIVRRLCLCVRFSG